MIASDESLDTLMSYADALRENRKFTQAIEAYRQALHFGASRERVEFALAALGVGPTPAFAPADYVRNYFDRFAGGFDEKLRVVLRYKVPELLLEPLAAWIRGRSVDALDLGCGTGLCAALLRPSVTRLVGVDISERMLEQARELQVYDELVCADIVDALGSRRKSFDLVVAADVLVYVGDLHAVFGAVAAALRPGGLFAFTVEANDAAEFSLSATLRYAHSRTYIEALARERDLTIQRMDLQVLRQERQADVQGYVVVLRDARRLDDEAIQ